MRYLLLLFIIFFTAQALDAETLISQITEAIEQASPDSKFQYYQYRARAYSKINMPEAALADLTASINLNPTIPAYRERIDLLIKMGRYKEAINDLNIILKDYPNDLQTYRLRSKTYYKMKQYKKTLDDINIILETDPGDLEMYSLRSKTYYNMEQYEEAREDAWRALDANPNDKASRLIAMETTSALMPTQDIIMGSEEGHSSSTGRSGRKVKLKPNRSMKLSPYMSTMTSEKPRKVRSTGATKKPRKT